MAESFLREALGADTARFAIVVSCFNEPVTAGLLDGAKAALSDCGASNITVYRCPGAFEIPLVAKRLAASGNVDAIVCLGAVVKGQTYHFEVISDTVVRAIQQVALDTGIPVTLGVITPLDAAQAHARSGRDHRNKGREAAIAAVEMVILMQKI